MNYVTQTILAERPDGHNRHGIPGNCMQAAVATICELPLEEVPHFAVYTNWFAMMRRWALSRGFDFAYVEFPVDPQNKDWWENVVSWGRLCLLGGASPRGPFGHMVVGTPDRRVVHDPHPSRAGLATVEDAIVRINPYLLPPVYTAELPCPR